MAQLGDEYLAVLKVSYDYDPQSEDELAVKENQIVFLLEKTDDDWWKVKIKGDSQEEDNPSGLVPAAYVEQAEHASIAKAIYDYDAAATGELSIREDEILMVYDREDEWILVQSQKEGGKAGFVPGNYIEESSGEEQVLEPEPEPEPEPVLTPPPQVLPPSPKPPVRPTSVYVDPADRVAQTPVKLQADNIKTWAVSEVDKKGKKKKGTLGIGNGSLFFASESDKTPVQKWDTIDVEDFTIERHKHILIDMGGRNPTKLHFNVGKEEIAETILTKLDDSRKLAISNARIGSEAVSAESRTRRSSLTPPPRSVENSSPKKNSVSVRFTEESPQIIPPREASEEGEAEGGVGLSGNEQDGEPATALYDFKGNGPDELSVAEGERLYIIEREGEEWWKCKNVDGDEGVVPASYLESLGSSVSIKLEDDARKARERQEVEKKEREARELAEREQKKAERERAKAAAMAERKRQEREQAAESSRKQLQEASNQSRPKAERESGTSGRSRSSANSGPQGSSSTRGSSEYKNAPSPETTRIWHDRSGQFRVEAALIGYANGKLRLHKVNGVVIEVPSEKMSVEDMRYVERLVRRKSSSSSAAQRGTPDDDDQPLAFKRQPEVTKRDSQKRGPQVDWFDFFLSAGCDVDDCTRYAHSFEKDKIDESLLPDITESTMRSLGLREGDIIRVNKAIQQKYAEPSAPPLDHLASDEELAKRLQEEENAKKPVSPAPNLFTAGPGGALKNNTQRRGRPQPKNVPSTVDLDAIGTASEQIKRPGSPLTRTDSPVAISAVQPPQRSSSAMAAVSGFDDDAWTNRPGPKSPSSNSVPSASAPPPRATSVPPPAQAAAAPSPVPPIPARESTAISTGTVTVPNPLAKTTEADIFDQLARLSDLKTNRTVPPVPPLSVNASSASAAPVNSPRLPPSYNGGLGMGSSPSPMGQHLQNQQSGALLSPQQNGPRGPYAPVPANQGLLHPLIPTQTGFNSFVPTRHSNVSPFQPQPPQPSFLQPHVTGYSGNPPTLVSQPTGFLPSGPILSQPTGINGLFSSLPTASTFPSITTPPVQPSPTGLSSLQTPFNNIISTSSPAPANSSSIPNTSPANIFAQMKSGTFASGNEHSTPQQADKYDALRVDSQPTGWIPQPAGWGIQPNAGFQSGYTGF